MPNWFRESLGGGSPKKNLTKTNVFVFLFFEGERGPKVSRTKPRLLPHQRGWSDRQPHRQPPPHPKTQNPKNQPPMTKNRRGETTQVKKIQGWGGGNWPTEAPGKIKSPPGTNKKKNKNTKENCPETGVPPVFGPFFTQGGVKKKQNFLGKNTTGGVFFFWKQNLSWEQPGNKTGKNKEEKRNKKKKHQTTIPPPLRNPPNKKPTKRGSQRYQNTKKSSKKKKNPSTGAKRTTKTNKPSQKKGWVNKKNPVTPPGVSPQGGTQTNPTGGEKADGGKKEAPPRKPKPREPNTKTVEKKKKKQDLQLHLSGHPDVQRDKKKAEGAPTPPGFWQNHWVVEKGGGVMERPKGEKEVFFCAEGMRAPTANNPPKNPLVIQKTKECFFLVLVGLVGSQKNVGKRGIPKGVPTNSERKKFPQTTHPPTQPKKGGRKKTKNHNQLSLTSSITKTLLDWGCDNGKKKKKQGGKKRVVKPLPKPPNTTKKKSGLARPFPNPTGNGLCFGFPNQTTQSP